jgi:drug/metabolite transporter (DMT)-like permease
VEKGETMMTVFLGLTVALLWGGADTVATIATRRVGSSTTTFVAQLVGFLLLAVFGLAFAGRLGLWPDTLSVLSVSVLWGIGLGGVSALAYLTLYKSLSHGLLAVVSPVISAQGGVTLILAIVLLQEHLEGFQMLFLLLTFVGVILASMNVRELVKMRLKSLLGPGVRYALVSLLCFGALSFGVGLAARQSNWLISVFFIRCFSFLFLTAILRSQSPEKRAKQSRALGYFLAGIVGCADMADPPEPGYRNRLYWNCRNDLLGLRCHPPIGWRLPSEGATDIEPVFGLCSARNGAGRRGCSRTSAGTLPGWALTDGGRRLWIGSPQRDYHSKTEVDPVLWSIRA